MKIKLIVAATENNVIGIKNNLPWNLPDDMKYFKNKTIGSTVIMGKKNYLSIPKKFRPLKERTNIVLTTDNNFQAKDCVVENSLEAAIKNAKKLNKDIFIIGGGMVYKYALNENLVDIIYLTRIHATIPGDTFFPKIDSSKWETIKSKFHPKDNQHKYDFTFFKMKKINSLL